MFKKVWNSGVFTAFSRWSLDNNCEMEEMVALFLPFYVEFT